MNVYEIVTDKIIKQLEQGVIPWRKGWKSNELPKNYVSGKPYRGINIWLLQMEGRVSPYWLSFKQASALGGKVKKGEKGTLVVFWKMLKAEDTDKETGEHKNKLIPLLRYYIVFNADQVEGLPEKAYGVKHDFKPIEACEKLIEKYTDKPEVQFEDLQAYYVPSKDFVNMPKKEAFFSDAEYYATLFHEFVHSTGHEKRLHRKDFNEGGFGSESYSKEELIAEFGASFLCGIAGIEQITITNSCAYIKGWLVKLQNDKHLLIHASAQAQKAVDYMQGIKQPEAVNAE
jgi:antirestriction protein ArdC